MSSTCRLGIYRTRRLVLQSVRQTRRFATENSNPFPYPTRPNPPPHHIFHLPMSATQQQIKQRYYDLVRIYHPDSPVARHSPPEVVQARFQSIAKAYDLLRGKNDSAGEPMTSPERHVDPARFGSRASRRPYFDDTPGDDRWKERTIFAAVIFTLVAFVAQTTVTRHQAISQSINKTRTRSSTPRNADSDGMLAEPVPSTNPRTTT
ncbi:hypothetical protein F5I97DRAFT_1803133 [Phlebopus sp. FC_14]|nr:hypothetical protein F5I97DRAFT_1803133 [Phlebopus sp. FC_14]